MGDKKHKENKWIHAPVLLITLVLILAGCQTPVPDNSLTINEKGYFHSRGVDIFVFNNWYNENFGDSKMSGIEIIHHEKRTVTNGDVRLSPTPEQWDPIPKFIDRSIDQENNFIEAKLSYPEKNFSYTIRTEASENLIIISVYLESPIPVSVEGKAGFNLEFLPSAYFGKTYLMDNKSGVLPLYPSGPMDKAVENHPEAKPFASGHKLVMAPNDPERRITVESDQSLISLYDGRNRAQNGWYVLRTLIPPGISGKVIEWKIKVNALPGWTREPVIAYSQVGYHPGQQKKAVIEIDRNDRALSAAKLFKIKGEGQHEICFIDGLAEWGDYLRYNYLLFDFSEIKEEGLYFIEYGNLRTDAFRIANDVYYDAWHPTLDVFFPVQMDHMLVNEAYRVWHGASHLDDALQAPVNHSHFDMYAQGPTTDTPYEPGEHIPGLNRGGWFDAGDFDIRTQTQYAVVLHLVHSWEDFRQERDETLIDQSTRYVDIHHPDGKPDMLQQIEHGAIALLAQHEAVGHAINGIIVSNLSQYTHLGDAMTMTDNLIYNPRLDSLESDGFTSGTFDDRWAFTSRSTALNYGSAAALAAAGRALQEYNANFAKECITTARKVWLEEEKREPSVFRNGNTTGGPIQAEKLKAAVELLITTEDDKYRQAIDKLMPEIEDQFAWHAVNLAYALPYMNEEFGKKIRSLTMTYRDTIVKFDYRNPYGVPISTGGWAGNGWVVYFSLTNYALHKAFPEIIDKEYVFRGLTYIFGCHPGSNISFVSGVGVHSKKIAYGNNRADYSFIAGGIVPGVLILPPDFPENKEDWPFLWGENEYVIGLAAAYIYLVQAALDLTKES
jgi:hypothetical protein